MTRQDYTLYAYKTDKRTKSGEKLVNIRVLNNMDEQTMKAIVEHGLSLSPDHRFEYFPTKITVKNLMTGKDVQIDRDTPWCCNPASETYWSM
jgi:hypothetical protein